MQLQEDIVHIEQIGECFFRNPRALPAPEKGAVADGLFGRLVPECRLGCGSYPLNQSLEASNDKGPRLEEVEFVCRGAHERVPTFTAPRCRIWETE